MGGCGHGGGDIPVSLAEIVVVDVPDSFTVALVGINFSGTVDRAWDCRASQANLSLGTEILGGSVHIVVEDASGATVYDNTHGSSISGLSAPTKPGGTLGTWHVTMTFSGCVWEGAISLSADNPPTPDVITIGSGFSTSASWTFYAGWSDASTTPVSVTIASGLSSGSIRIRLWDGAGTSQYDQTISPPTGAVADSISAGAAGTWTIQLDLSGASAGSAISIHQ
jgi:hypothetical protein